MISKSIFTFLKKLESNNNRDWFQKHRDDYDYAHKEIKIIYHSILDVLQKHDSIDKLKLFRLYRDIRFSKNKQPYKTHFGGSFHRVKPKLRGGYYLHLQPNDKSFIATGFWEPEKNDLMRIRKEFEQDDYEIRNIINEKKFQSIWGNLVGSELKTAPRSFDKNHSAIDLIRKKQFIFTHKFSDENVLSSNFINNVNCAFKTIRPFFDYMSDVLTTDLNGTSILK